MSDVFDEIIKKLKQKAKTPEEALHILANEKLQKFYKNYKNKEWVRLEDVKKELQRLKQRVCEVIDQYIKAYPLDTPEDRQLSKVLNEIREELLKEKEENEYDAPTSTRILD